MVKDPMIRFLPWWSAMIGVILFHTVSWAVSPDRADLLRRMRDQTLEWAFRAEDGGVATNHLNDQGDMPSAGTISTE